MEPDNEEIERYQAIMKGCYKIMLKKLLSLGLVLMTLLGLMIPMMSSASADAASTAFVNCSNGGKLNVRLAPITNAQIVTRIANGTKVEILNNAAPAGWAYVRETAKGTNGYVMTKFLSKSKPSKYMVTEPDRNFVRVATPYTVTAKALNRKTVDSVGLRVSPNKSSAMIRRLHAGDQLQVIAIAKTWSQVVDPATGMTGYVANDYMLR